MKHLYPSLFPISPKPIRVHTNFIGLNAPYKTTGSKKGQSVLGRGKKYKNSLPLLEWLAQRVYCTFYIYNTQTRIIGMSTPIHMRILLRYL